MEYQLTQTGEQVQNILDQAPTTEQNLQSEITRSTEKDQELETAIGNEKTRAEGVESNLQTAIENEVSRAEGVEGNLQTAITNEKNRAEGVEGGLRSDVDAIEGKIPTSASDQNKLATEGFVNSSISTNTADFKGTYNSIEELQTEVPTATANDYAFVISTDASGNTVYNRYKYVTGTGWTFEYALNNSSFTSAQWASINSAITTALVAKLNSLPNAAELTQQLNAIIDSVATEKARAEGIEAGLRTDVNANAAAIVTEKNRAQGVEGTLTNGLNAEILNRQNADTALQQNINAEAMLRDNADDALQDEIDGIDAKIPTQASPSNQLADKAFVNSSIATNTGEFKGTYNSLTELQAVTNVNANDYGFVIATDGTGNTVYNRYKYVTGQGWVFEYALNNSSFTAAQWGAINSGITAALAAKINGLPDIDALNAMFAAITSKIPADASSSNKLVDYAQLVYALSSKQDTLIFDNVPTENSNNPVKSGGIYQSIATVTAAIVGLQSSKQDVLTFDQYPTAGSNNPVRSGGINTWVGNVLEPIENRVSVNEDDIKLLREAYRGLTESDIIVGTLPASGVANKIYRVPGTSTYADWMYYNGAWVKLAEYTTLDGYLYKGIAVPTGSPAVSAVKIFYFALTAGTYTNFGNLVVTEGISILKYDGANWTQDKISYMDGGVFDVTAYSGREFASLSALLSDANLNNLIPTAVQKGGMRIQFVESSDNKYVQYRLMNQNWSTIVSDWQGVDDEPTAGSDNLVKSSGVAKKIAENGLTAVIRRSTVTRNSNNIVTIVGIGLQVWYKNKYYYINNGTYTLNPGDSFILSTSENEVVNPDFSTLSTNTTLYLHTIGQQSVTADNVIFCCNVGANGVYSISDVIEKRLLKLEQDALNAHLNARLAFSEVAYRFQPSSISFDNITKILTLTFTSGTVTLTYKNKYFHITGGTYTLENSKSFILSTSSEELIFPNLETLASNTDLYLYKTDVLFSYDFIYLFASNIGGSIYSLCGLIENALNNSVIDATIGDVRNLIKQRIIETNLIFTGVFSASKNAVNTLTFTTNNAHGWTKQGKYFLIPNGTYTLVAGDYIVLSESDSEYVRPTLNNIINGTTLYLKTIHQQDLTFDDIPVIINAGTQGVASVGNFIEDELNKAELNHKDLTRVLNSDFYWTGRFRALKDNNNVVTFTADLMHLWTRNGKWFIIPDGTYTLSPGEYMVLSSSDEELIRPDLANATAHSTFYLKTIEQDNITDNDIRIALNAGAQGVHSICHILEDALLDKSLYDFSAVHASARSITASKDSNNIITFISTYLRVYAGYGKWFVIPDGTYTLSPGYALVLSATQNSLSRPNLNALNAGTTLYLVSVQQGSAEYNSAVVFVNNVGTMGSYSISNIIEKALFDNGNSQLITGLNQIICKGAKVSVIGDSISTFTGTMPEGYMSYYPNSHASVSDVASVSDTWWYKVINNLGAELLINASFSGSGATRITIGGTERLNFYSRANTQVLGNPDIVFVALGTNDSGEQKTIGSEYHYDTPIADLSEDEFCDAYIKGIKSLMEIDSVKIIVCVLLKIDDDDYSNAIRTIASHYNLPVIEAGDYANVGAGPHPNAAGMTSIFEFFKNDTSHLELMTKSIREIAGLASL